MPLLSSAEVLVFLLTAVFITLYHREQKQKATSACKLPPGPPKLPFFGNLFQVPVLRPYPKFREWAKEYGPIFHLRMGPQDVIVLNTADAADELFVHRSKSFSSRTPPHVAHDIVSAGQRLVFLPYGKEWKAARKSLHSSIGPGPSRKIRTCQELESRVLLYDILQHGEKGWRPLAPGPNGEVPEDHWFSLVRRYATSIVMTVCYGRRANTIIRNRYLHKIYAVLANIVIVGQPGNYLADVFPILRQLPDWLSSWRTEGRKMHCWEMELWGGLLDELRDDLNKGVENNSYIGGYLRQRVEAGKADAPGCGITEDGWLRDTLLAYTAGTVLEAGSDTTASTIQSFILFMLSHPHVLEKVRAEVDAVVGSDRMPQFEDEPNLPYMVAAIKETLRKRPPTVMGIPHKADEDSIYDGYKIPKGSTVIGNVWAIHMDPTRYPNPTAYQPERWYTPGKPTRWGSGPELDQPLTMGHSSYVFGWGRRFCQGSHIAEASLFISLSRLIWGVEFEAPKDPKTGVPQIPDVGDEEGTFSDGFVKSMYIRAAREDDLPRITRILNYYIANTVSTFRSDQLPTDPLASPLLESYNIVQAQHLPFLVALDGNTAGAEDTMIVGYSYAVGYRQPSHPCYSPTAEVTVYVHPDWQSRGIGTALMDELMKQLRTPPQIGGGTHQVRQVLSIMSVDEEGPGGGYGLRDWYTRWGFVQVGRLGRVGFKFGRWLDTLILQASLEES
ncbi:hypothetical protein AX17_006664 [Amanita inopinata Kibby_2008]|nr:hypothetical protein AX17_006664 [Amanita inopinata Kibby_2008]